MIVEQIYTKSLSEAAYYIESNNEAAIIDPLRETNVYLERANQSGAKIKYIFETHFHADFVSGHVDLAKKCGGVIVYGPTAKTSYDIYEGKDNEEFKIGDVLIKLLHTPGHTQESSTFLLIDENGKQHAIFTGDTLFIGDVGRPDLATKSDVSTEDLAGILYESIHSKIMPLEGDVIVYPAHGAGSACGKKMSKETFSTLSEQKKNNYALQNISKEEFIKQVTEGILPAPLYFSKVAEMNRSGYKSIDDVKSEGGLHLTVEEMEGEVAKGAVLLDTRPAQTFNKGFVPGSINIGLDGAFELWAATLIHDVHKRVIILSVQERQVEAITRLAAVGIDNIAGHLEGSFEAWQSTGRPIDTIESISPEELEKRMDGNECNLLDVRKPMEYEVGHVDIAKNMPLDYIYQNLEKLEREKTYYIHCQGGYRSMTASSILKARGFNNVIDIDGGYFTMVRRCSFNIV